MEAGMKLISSSPPFISKKHLKNSSSSSSVSKLHEQATPSLISVPTNFVSRQIPTSVLLQEHRDEYSPLLQITKEKKNSSDSDLNPKDYERELTYLLPLLTNTQKVMNVKVCDAIVLAKTALIASKEAASLAEKSKELSISSISLSVQEDETVKSKRLLERRLKRRKVSKLRVIKNEYKSCRRTVSKRKVSEKYDTNNPLRFFLWGPETKRLLTSEEETKVVGRIQVLLKLEEVKKKLKSQFNREPTLVEWAEAVGFNSHDLQLEIQAGKRSREKLINANLRMVVHIAKQYLGRGLNLQDLLQEGSMGLMKSVERFKTQAGCRFASYAYWWIRQTIRRAIFNHSRTIRLPGNVYCVLGKVTEAKKICIDETHVRPTKEELAQRVGITVEKLQRLLFSARFPLSIQQPIWTDQDTTFQEITADTQIENPNVSVEKQRMRKHVHDLLTILPPRERHIILLRFGIEGGKRKTLSDIGLMYGLSRERIRQLESRAIRKLEQCLNDQGIEGYTNLIV